MSGANTTQSPLDITTVTAETHNDANAVLTFQPNEALPDNNFITIEGIGQVPIAPAPRTDAMRLQGDTEQSNGLGLGISLMQSSPPPHSYRHSRAYRHFKNPPQPHMCIRTTTDVGEELFINVLSWTRIVIPQEPSDPIPLYGGMRVPPGSPRSPPIVFAVMANPEVLKDSGRHSKDPDERRAMVELMCDFVEAMNPGVKLVRNAVILKDRDISGELKDVWNAVQAQRDREREEQIMQQRQQQHYHNSTMQQNLPKANAETEIKASETVQNSELSANVTSLTSAQEKESNVTAVTKSASAALSPLSALAQQMDSKMYVSEGVGNNIGPNSLESLQETAASATNGPISPSNSYQQQPNDSCDQLDARLIEVNAKNSVEEKITRSNIAADTINSSKEKSHPKSANNSTKAPKSPTAPSGGNTKTSKVAAAPATAPTKKEKLGGFLPNGCIFPRFKNNKNKDKESKPKEKTLLNALKKSKDKKVAPIEHVVEKNNIVTEPDSKSQLEKNCINLETEVEKLDINKIEASNNSDIFIKLKLTTPSAAATAN